MNSKPKIVFDVGGVLIGWDPKRVYQEMFDNKDEIKWFFENICTPEWNRKQDAGRTFEEATAELLSKFPEFHVQIQAYYDRWEEMVTGEITESVEILKSLNDQRYELYALTNWSAQSYKVIRERYGFFDLFNGIVVSAHERQTKPDPELYQTLFSRYGLTPSECIFIDDTKVNIDTARNLGMKGIHFISSKQMKADLKRYNIE